MQARADFLDQQLGPEIPDDRADFARLCRRYDQASGIRITLLLPDGKVDFDSQNRPEELENQLEPSRDSAGPGRRHRTTRCATTPALDQRVLYLAVPVLRNDRLFGVLYLSTPLTALDQALCANAGLAAGRRRWLLALLTAPLAWWVLARHRAAAGPNAAGRPNGWPRAAGARGWPCPIRRNWPNWPSRFNRMADQLQQRIGVLIQNNNEQKAVLASMAEGVLAVDSQERVISMNTASGRLLGLDQTQAQGRRLQEVVRNADLSRFISRALACQDPIEADVLLHGDRERVMQAHGSALHDLEGPADRRRDRAQRRDRFSPAGAHPPRFRGQRVARAEDARHVDQGLRRNAARRRDATTRSMPSGFCGSSPSRPIGCTRSSRTC